MQRRGLIYGVVAVAAIALAGYGWHAAGLPIPGLSSSAKKPQPPPPLPIHAWRVREEKVPVTFRYTARVVSPKVAELRARVTGVITERPFHPGGQVHQGDVLFRIDPRPFETALAQAIAQRDQAQANVVYGDAQVARFTPLARRGFASEERLQQVTRDRDTALSQVHQAEAQIMRERLNLEYAVVRAPFDGRAGLTDVNVGDMATANQTQLVTVAQFNPIDVQVALSSADLRAVRAALGAGRQPEIDLLDAQGKPDGRRARIVAFDNQYNPRTARLLVRARVANADGYLSPGGFVRVRLQTGTAQRLLVPTAALSARLNQQVVYVVHGGKAHTQPVVATDQYGDKTIIEKGLKPGVEVAIDHVQRLRDGKAVRVEGVKNETPQEATAER